MKQTLSISEEIKNNTTIYSLSGRLDSQTVHAIEEKIQDSLNSGTIHLILDLSSLTYISSAGIRLVLHAHKKLKKVSGDVYLTAIPKPIENTLYITGFLPYFKIYDSTTAALASLK